MSGRNQHYIPKMLLEGFAMPVRRAGRHHIWQYGGTPAPVSVNVRDAARDRDFYSEPTMAGAGPTLDDLITEYEGSKFAPKLASLWLSTPGAIIPSNVAAEIAAHLIVRAAHFRDVFRMCVSAMIDSMMKLRADPRFAKALIGYGQAEGDTFREMLRAQLSQIEDLPPDLAARLEKATHAFFGEFIEIRALMNARAKAPPIADFEARIAQSQRDTLQKSLLPEHHIKRLSQFEWTTQKRQANSLVLPDCIAMEFAGGEWRPCSLWDDNTPEGIVMPLTHNMLLVGRGSNDWTPPNEIVPALVGCSARFFFAPVESWQNESNSIATILRQTVDRTLTKSMANSEIGKLGFPIDEKGD